MGHKVQTCVKKGKDVGIRANEMAAGRAGFGGKRT